MRFFPQNHHYNIRFLFLFATYHYNIGLKIPYFFTSIYHYNIGLKIPRCHQQSFVFLSNIFLLQITSIISALKFPIFLLQITTIISALKFPSFKLQSIITFDLKAVDNFYCHICYKHIKLVNIPENKENRSPPPQSVSTSPPM